MHIVIVLGCKRNLRGAPKKEIDKYSHVYSRLMKTVEVYNGIKSKEKIILCSGIGEAEVMKNFLVSQGIQPTKILVETESRNTVENCIYSYNYLYSWLKMEHCLEEIEGIDIDSLQRDPYRIYKVHTLNTVKNYLHLVTNDYHLERSKIIFERFLNRLKSCSLESCSGANILDYIEPTPEDQQEVFKAWEHDSYIRNKHLENSLTHYQFHYPPYKF